MADELSKLKPPEGATHRAKHKGRGMGSGDGKTSGRGQKGQKARKSGGTRPGFEGGAMPLQRRLPKRGFKNLFKKVFVEVRISHLDRFEDGSVVDWDSLRSVGLAKGQADGVKVIGNGALNRKLTVKVHRISAGARASIEQAGGTVELIPDKKKWVRSDTRVARRQANAS
ncbi:MAG: 50S ribosomal protein L15 [Myxococcales bacterium]|nr:50S ribosomal protein L15 [Myxococcales bacterium]